MCGLLFRSPRPPPPFPNLASDPPPSGSRQGAFGVYQIRSHVPPPVRQRVLSLSFFCHESSSPFSSIGTRHHGVAPASEERERGEKPPLLFFSRSGLEELFLFFPTQGGRGKSEHPPPPPKKRDVMATFQVHSFLFLVTTTMRTFVFSGRIFFSYEISQRPALSPFFPSDREGSALFYTTNKGFRPLPPDLSSIALSSLLFPSCRQRRTAFSLCPTTYGFCLPPFCQRTSTSPFPPPRTTRRFLPLAACAKGRLSSSRTFFPLWISLRSYLQPVPFIFSLKVKAKSVFPPLNGSFFNGMELGHSALFFFSPPFDS